MDSDKGSFTWDKLFRELHGKFEHAWKGDMKSPPKKLAVTIQNYLRHCTYTPCKGNIYDICNMYIVVQLGHGQNNSLFVHTLQLADTVTVTRD